MHSQLKRRCRNAGVNSGSCYTACPSVSPLQVEYLMANPLAKHQVREVIWKKESEITMVEALVKLTNVHDNIAASLEQAPVF